MVRVPSGLLPGPSLILMSRCLVGIVAIGVSVACQNAAQVIAAKSTKMTTSCFAVSANGAPFPNSFSESELRSKGWRDRKANDL